ncbi:hypothetical protein Leryth_023997 [Lithospermum erythrorhizon]|nr:hypothetical protein Leryth_023997 [Lithospermum erythrorhizon]
MLTSISTFPIQIIPSPIFSIKIASSSSPFSSRLLCTSSTQTKHDPIHMEKYKQLFSTKMALAGLKPHHRIALGVSGGPDSMALCVLAAAWKTKGIVVATKESSEIVDGLLAIVIDHGLRAESRDEANIVGRRVLEMGIRCEIVQCEWSDGKPKQGQLQEAARDKRYQIFQKVCIRHRIGVLLLAHHADDQAELFIIRLSRGSGVMGLAGMPFTSQLFAKCQDIDCKASSGHGILLARPLLDLYKQDMYQICQGSDQEWVEDPTNQNPSFTRNRIRMSLKDVSSSVVKVELLELVSACRRIRQYVDKACSLLMHQAVSIMPEGYAVIDLGTQNMSEVEDVILSRFVSLVLQFVSQRQRPVRGSALKLLLNYIRTSPCKTCLTAAGCYLCPCPGSKGKKVLVCCTVNDCLPLKLEVSEAVGEVQSCTFTEEVEEIVDNGRSLLDLVGPTVFDVNFLSTSSESILDKAREQNILSESSYRKITFIQRTETDNFKRKNGIAIQDSL